MQVRLRTGRYLMPALGLALACAPLFAQDNKTKDKKSDAPAPAAVQSTAGESDDEYIIGGQDNLSISVWRENDFSGPVIVRPDGKVTMPLLGDMQAAGLTPMQLATSITEKLRKYVAEPRVTVVVTQMNSQRFYIMGEVGRGGAFPLQARTTVLQALASAGGFTELADTKKIYVLRKENGKEVKYPFNYKEVIKGNHREQNIIVKPGDTIVVP
jgi:polysaccharide export outer membrane protein